MSCLEIMQNREQEEDRYQGRRDEYLESARSFFPSTNRGIESTVEILREIRTPASEYRNPLGWRTRLRISLNEWFFSSNQVIGDTYAYHGFPFELRWKKVFDHIYKLGITRYPYPSFDKVYHDEPKVFGIRLWARNGETDGFRVNSGYSRGVSSDFEEALSKVVGELLERYPLTLYRNKNLISASIGELRRRGVPFFNPFFLDQFSNWQKERFPEYRFNETSRFRWVKGKSLMTGKTALIPAQMVFWNYRFSPSEPVLRHVNTSGNGGMFTLTEALLSGLYELVQRDAFLLFWLNRIAPPRVDIASVRNREARALLESCLNYGLKVSILDVTSDFGVSTVIAVLEDEYGGGPSVVLGGGCGVDPEEAIVRSLTEAISIRYWLRGRMDKGKSFMLAGDLEPFTTTALNYATRVLYWGTPGMREKIQFFLQGELRSIDRSFSGAPRESMTSEQQLRHLKKIFQEKGERYEIFYYEAKHEALDTLGYFSVSVSVPAILPLYMDESKAPLGNPRLQEACRILGYEPAENLNPLPHPFP